MEAFAAWWAGDQRVAHEADVDDGRYDAPEAPGFDLALRGLSMVEADQRVLELSGPLFEGAYEFFRRQLLFGAGAVVSERSGDVGPSRVRDVVPCQKRRGCGSGSRFRQTGNTPRFQVASGVGQ